MEETLIWYKPGGGILCRKCAEKEYSSDISKFPQGVFLSELNIYKNDMKLNTQCIDCNKKMI
ncbi:MAG: hypothetical protein ACJ0OY_01410 [Dehalococcoidia bacterium]|tara:strand:- start:948 stop:1133 length:186 start_codon:yes stop_codon:yes gene_type:complete